ncbi:MAG: hypothetical protein AB7F66_01150 [Bacteriovoracia bacterium]
MEYTDRGAPVLSVGGTLPTASVKEAQEAWQELITTVHPHFGSSIGGQRPWDAYPTTVIPRLDPKISFADYERVILGMYPKSDKPIVQKINFFGRTEKIKLGTFEVELYAHLYHDRFLQAYLRTLHERLVTAGDQSDSGLVRDLRDFLAHVSGERYPKGMSRARLYQPLAQLYVDEAIRRGLSAADTPAELTFPEIKTAPHHAVIENFRTKDSLPLAGEKIQTAVRENPAILPALVRIASTLDSEPSRWPVAIASQRQAVAAYVYIATMEAVITDRTESPARRLQRLFSAEALAKFLQLDRPVIGERVRWFSLYQDTTARAKTYLDQLQTEIGAP